MSSAGRFEGQVAVVTGGGRGIGAGIAARLAAEGARVVIAQRDPESAASTVTAIQADGGESVAITADVAQPESVADLMRETVARFGRIDILVNNAGIAGTLGPFLDIAFDTWRQVLDTNLTGAFLCGQAAARVMVDHQIEGRIINVGSVNSFIAQADAAPYVASKGGLLMLTKAMAVDLARYGIRVNMVAPGSIRVARNTEYYDREPLRTMFAKGVPLGHPGTPGDIAGAVAFLASEDARFITGASLIIDGGFTSFFRIE